jgi:hypothetical protein
MLRKTLTRANNTQRLVLVATILFYFFAQLFTWDFVIYRGIGQEASEWTAVFISRYGAIGLLISSTIFSSFVVFWILWVWVSKGERDFERWNHKYIGVFSVGISTMAFLLSFFDFANDLMMFGFRSNVLLPFLRPPLILIPIFLAGVLSLSQIYPKLFFA